MEPFLAEIIMFGGNFAPRGWAFCDGQLLPISQYSALFSLLGTIYGGDGRTTFALPDLRGRVPVHAGHGPGLSDYRLGSKGGVENVTLNQTQMPSHTHTASGTVKSNSGAGDSTSPDSNYAAEASEDIYAQSTDSNMAKDAVQVTVNNTGGNQPHENRQPYLAVNYIIALQGTFPSRS